MSADEMEIGARIVGAAQERIPRSGTVRPLPSIGLGPSLITGLRVHTDEWGDSSIEEILRRHQSHTLVVLHRGRLALEWLAPDADAGQRHRCYSVTKSFTGTLAAIAMAEGRLDRAARVGDLIGELAASGFADATVGEVADMTVSVGYDEDYQDRGRGDDLRCPPWVRRLHGRPRLRPRGRCRRQAGRGRSPFDPGVRGRARARHRPPR